MVWITAGITRVRVRPLVLTLTAGRPAAALAAVEVTWAAPDFGFWHQVYVNGQLAAATLKPEDRRLVVPVPVGRGGALRPLLVEVAAVEAGDRWTDYASGLPGLIHNVGPRAVVRWQAGPYLDPNLEAFDVFGDGRSGGVDYSAPLNESPIPARPDGRAPWGYGCHAYGAGGYGAGAAFYEWTTDPLEPGAWRFGVVAVDQAGNRLAGEAETGVVLTPHARPPSDFRVADYDPAAGAALAWEPGPDV